MPVSEALPHRSSYHAAWSPVLRLSGGPLENAAAVLPPAGALHPPPVAPGRRQASYIPVLGTIAEASCLQRLSSLSLSLLSPLPLWRPGLKCMLGRHLGLSCEFPCTHSLRRGQAMLCCSWVLWNLNLPNSGSRHSRLPMSCDSRQIFQGTCLLSVALGPGRCSSLTPPGRRHWVPP